MKLGVAVDSAYIRAARDQHSRDRIIMEKLLEANRVMREALDFDYPYFAAKQHKLIDLAKEQKEALIKADKIMRGIEW